MKKCYLLILPLLFSACVDTPEPVSLVNKFKAYDPIQNSCIKLSKDETLNKDGNLVFEKINNECKKFIEVLEGTNLSYKKKELNKNNAAYYSAKEKYKKENNRLKKQHRHLNLILKNKGLDAIEEDNLDTFTKVVNFSAHPMNISYYSYMQRHTDLFKGNKKLIKFEKKYGKKQYESGYSLVNRGKYTQGLADLLVAAKMKNIPAAKLCGDIFRDLYPSKAGLCYSLAVQAGDKSSIYALARYYEDEENLSEAQTWYMKSAKLGNFISQYKLYKLDKDKAAQEKWLKKSADGGYDKAQYEYGLLLSKNKKTQDAKKYLQKAADQGLLAANYPLGKLYFKDKQYKQAYTLLSHGDVNADSMYKLAYLKEHGKGTDKNYYSATNYYLKAKNLGKSGVQKDLKRIKKIKSRLRSHHAKRQKVQEVANLNKIKENRQRRYEAIKEDKRIRDQWSTKKAQEIQLKADACGLEPDRSNLRNSGERIHLEGKLSHWLGKNAFIVNVNGEEYYVKDADDKARANKGDKVNFVAISTGRREITHGLRRSLFEEADETAIQKAYALNFEGVCPY